jgi:hypothetical protein
MFHVGSRSGLFTILILSAAGASAAENQPVVPLAPDTEASPSLAVPEAQPSSSAPAGDVAVVAAVPAPVRQRMGWFGAGVRVGMQDIHLAPAAYLVSAASAASGQAFAAGSFDVDANALTVTPTLHFGGSGYFFKLDVPFSFASQFTTFGIGLYPINYGVYVADASLFPYLSIGGAANLVDSRDTGDPGTSNKLIGAIFQARGAIGLKYFPARNLAVSGELGYSPWAAGVMLVTPAGEDQTQVHGGTGSMFDFSLGVEWL